jgi:hypothetical protein
MLRKDRERLSEEQAAAALAAVCVESPAREELWWIEPELEEPSDASEEPPSTAAAPCSTCGSPFFWSDLAGIAHCCGCVPIPAKRMAQGGWVVAWSEELQRSFWQEHEFQRWNPFGHLERVCSQDDASENF